VPTVSLVVSDGRLRKASYFFYRDVQDAIAGTYDVLLLVLASKWHSCLLSNHFNADGYTILKLTHYAQTHSRSLLLFCPPLSTCSAAVAHVGDMQDAVEAALGVSGENAVAGGDDDDDDEKTGRKRYRTKDEDDEDEKPINLKRAVPSHEDQLAARRSKDRERYALMTRKCKAKKVNATV
jgi:hypothetical protein